MHIKNFDPLDFSKKELNGVDVYYKNLPWSPCVHIRMIFSVGAFNDPVNKEGLAHFLEHMISDGSPMLKDKKELREFSRTYMLNSKNAFTGHYLTGYTGKCLPENLSKVLEAMKDYIFKPFLRDEDVEHERKVITQEAWGVYKNIKFLNYIKEFSNNLYTSHQRSRLASPLGWPETVAKITQADIAKYHKENYTKENLTVFIVGAVEEKDLETISKFTEDLPSGLKKEALGGALNSPKTLRIEKNSEEIGDAREQVSFTLARAQNKWKKDGRGIEGQARDLLYDALFERLRTEHSLCYGVHVSWSKAKDFEDVVISVETSEDKLELVEKEVWNVINEIIDGKWSDRFATIHKLKFEQVKSAERLSGDIISGASYDLIDLGRIKTVEEMLGNIEKVVYKDVQEIIKETFDSKEVVTEIIHPSKNK